MFENAAAMNVVLKNTLMSILQFISFAELGRSRPRVNGRVGPTSKNYVFLVNICENLGRKLCTYNSNCISSKRNSISVLVEHLLDQKWKAQATDTRRSEPRKIVNSVSGRYFIWPYEHDSVGKPSLSNEPFVKHTQHWIVYDLKTNSVKNALSHNQMPYLACKTARDQGQYAN